ncbi:MAG: stress response translation initiation inhibitor YciH [Desulfuromonas sp.]|nr:MAG: stress response translation initiation inhibitor YciH [Desulfuromonas sp.]
MVRNRSNSGLVYSSEHGRMCPGCGKPVAACACRKQGAEGSPGDGVVRVGRQTKGRKGKGVSLVSGVPLPEAELKQLAKELKKKCGTGGTLKDGVIEIQGDHRDLLVDLLSAKGWKVKLSGG